MFLVSDFINKIIPFFSLPAGKQVWRDSNMNLFYQKIKQKERRRTRRSCASVELNRVRLVGRRLSSPDVEQRDNHQPRAYGGDDRNHDVLRCEAECTLQKSDDERLMIRPVVGDARMCQLTQVARYENEWAPETENELDSEHDYTERAVNFPELGMTRTRNEERAKPIHDQNEMENIHPKSERFVSVHPSPLFCFECIITTNPSWRGYWIFITPMLLRIAYYVYPVKFWQNKQKSLYFGPFLTLNQMIKIFLSCFQRNTSSFCHEN